MKRTKKEQKKMIVTPIATYLFIGACWGMYRWMEDLTRTYSTKVGFWKQIWESTGILTLFVVLGAFAWPLAVRNWIRCR